MSNLEIVITNVADFIKRYKCLNSVTFKFTLGKYTNTFGFEKNLFHEEKYYEVLNLLNKCTSWEYKEEKSFTSFNEESDKIIDRMIILCDNGPFDILVTAQSTNSACTLDNVNIKQNIFMKKNHEYILTKSVDNFKTSSYIMTIIPKIVLSYKDTYISHSTLLKMCDLISVCNDNSEPLILTILQKNN